MTELMPMPDIERASEVLGPVDADAQGHHAQVIGEMHAVDHQRHQVEAGQVGGQHFGQRRLGGRHEAPAHRRLKPVTVARLASVLGELVKGDGRVGRR